MFMMKRLVWVGILIAILAFRGFAEKPEIDSRIYELLKTQQKVPVIVFLVEPVKNEPDFEDEDDNELPIEVKRERFVERKRAIAKKLQEKLISKLEKKDFELRIVFELTPGFSGLVTKNGMKLLEKNPFVKAVVYDEPLATTLQDSAGIIQAPQVWNLTINGQAIDGTGQTVCVIDTGIDYTHPGLGGCFGAGCKVVGGYDFKNGDPDPIDDQGHGTHVAGIVAGSGALKGIAPGAKLAALKACDNSLPSAICGSSEAVASIDWCISQSASLNINVITMSFGAGSYSSYCEGMFFPISSKISEAHGLGILTTVASGNNGNKTGIANPSCATNATSVGATTKSDTVPSFSQSASILDILAPGMSINSTALGGGYVVMSGTSMAAPHAAGAVALLQAYQQIGEGFLESPDNIEAVLKSTGTLITDPGNGLAKPRINIFNAYAALDDVAPNISYVPPTPPDGFSTSNTTVTIAIESNEKLSLALLEWDGVNESMTGTGTSWQVVKVSTPGTHFYKVYGKDSAGNWAFTATRTIIITSAPASLLWSAPFSGSARAVASSGSGVVAGGSNGNSWVLSKYNSSGSLLWSKSFQASSVSLTPGFDQVGVHDIAIDNAGNIIAVGTKKVGSPDDTVWVIQKYDPSGNLLWERLHNEPSTFKADVAYGVAVDSSDNVVVVGDEYAKISYGPETHRMRIIKYSPAGELIWQRVEDPTGGSDTPFDVAIDSANNIITAGVLGGTAWGIRKYSSSGTLLWSRWIISPSLTGRALGVVVDGSNNIYAAGWEGQNSMLRAFSPNGTTLWQVPVPGDSRAALDVTINSLGQLFVTGLFGTHSYDTSGNLLWSISDKGNAIASSGTGFYLGESTVKKYQ